jgi:hypothetical protein
VHHRPSVVDQNVPEKLRVRLFVVSVTVTSVKLTVIGGLQSGWKVAVADERPAHAGLSSGSTATARYSASTAFSTCLA